MQPGVKTLVSVVCACAGCELLWYLFLKLQKVFLQPVADAPCSTTEDRLRDREGGKGRERTCRCPVNLISLLSALDALSSLPSILLSTHRTRGAV
eukprot:934128-Rhodomonas_salina.2